MSNGVGGGLDDGLEDGGLHAHSVTQFLADNPTMTPQTLVDTLVAQGKLNQGEKRNLTSMGAHPGQGVGAPHLALGGDALPPPGSGRQSNSDPFASGGFNTSAGPVSLPAFFANSLAPSAADGALESHLLEPPPTEQ
eukprot:5469883-Prymnesium_polylepis.1